MSESEKNKARLYWWTIGLLILTTLYVWALLDTIHQNLVFELQDSIEASYKIEADLINIMSDLMTIEVAKTTMLTRQPAVHPDVLMCLWSNDPLYTKWLNIHLD